MAFDPGFEHDRIQSMVFSGFGKLPAARDLPLEIADPASARAGIAAVTAGGIDFGLPPRDAECTAQLALSAAGLRALGLPDEAVAGFGLAFRQGMFTPHRARILGDRRNGDVEWRGDDAAGLLTVFGADRATADAHADALLAELGEGWLASTRQLEGMALPGGREHFGWRDGLAQPRIRGLGRSAPLQDIVEPGEIVLGYRDNAGAVTTASNFEGQDLGRNGSYLVVRQLEQDVAAFWTEWLAHAGGAPDLAVWLASKALGRWPNGMPVTERAPRMPAPDPLRLEQPLFFRSDRQGHGCPLGAHIRRANPRDGLHADPAASLASSGRHRLLRRGRPYGPVAPPEVYPDAARVPTDQRGSPAGEPRGLMFACLCADIERQFEFVQQTWMNNTKQAGLYAEADPIADGEDLAGDRAEFTIPERPVRRRLQGVHNHVRTRGGGYYFLPGRDMLAVLAAIR